jgi:hypothetical protein
VGVTTNGSLSTKTGSPSGTVGSSAKVNAVPNLVLFLSSSGGSLSGINVSGAQTTATQLTPGGQATAALPADLVRVLQVLSVPAPIQPLTFPSARSSIIDTTIRPLGFNFNATPYIPPQVPQLRGYSGGSDGVMDVIPRDDLGIPVIPAKPVEPAKPADPAPDGSLEAFDAYFSETYATDQAIASSGAVLDASADDAGMVLNPVLLAACAMFFSGGVAAEEARTRQRRWLRQ